MQCATLHYDKYRGREATGQIINGSVKHGDDFILINREGKEVKKRVTRIQTYLGMSKIEQKRGFLRRHCLFSWR